MHVYVCSKNVSRFSKQITFVAIYPKNILKFSNSLLFKKETTTFHFMYLLKWLVVFLSFLRLFYLGSILKYGFMKNAE